MKLSFKKPAFIGLGLIALVSAIWLDFYLPEHTIATITGVEVKRTDKDGPISQKNPTDGPTTDVYYIYTERPGEKIRVFRNEDTEWGWPFYFKFNAADVQAKAKSMEFENGWPSSPPTAGASTCSPCSPTSPRLRAPNPTPPPGASSAGSGSASGLW